jgi:hypothetical protein
VQETAWRGGGQSETSGRGTVVLRFKIN